jgi:hypothetical protein
MLTIQLALQAASMRGWPGRQEANGEVRIEVPTEAGRTQLVVVTPARDGDGDAAAFIWSTAGDLRAIPDPLAALRYNMQLTYGKVAIKDQSVVIVHAFHDQTAQLAAVGKAIYWVARAADGLEKATYGAYSDTM